MRTRRQQRVNEFLKETLGNLIQYELRDPRLGMLTVTAVDVSPDLRHAHVHVSRIGGREEKQEALRALEHARGYIRRELALRVDLKFVPELTFHLDDSLERGARILRLIEEIEEESQG